MQLMPSSSAPTSARFFVELADSTEALREVQKLRYRVFVEAQGLSNAKNATGLEQDYFDAHCDHLVVRDRSTSRIVGTYRVMGPAAARRSGRLYAETEFDIGRLAHLRPRMAEAGRACVDPDYRGSAVLMLLWAALAEYLKVQGCDHLVGCASVSLADGGTVARALCHDVLPLHLAPLEYRAIPLVPFGAGAQPIARQPVSLPPLIKSYLKGGAWICGNPALDSDFQCADFLLLLSFERMDDTYARRFLKTGAEIGSRGTRHAEQVATERRPYMPFLVTTSS